MNSPLEDQLSAGMRESVSGLSLDGAIVGRAARRAARHSAIAALAAFTAGLLVAVGLAALQGTDAGKAEASPAGAPSAVAARPAQAAPGTVIEPIPDILEREAGVAGKAAANKLPTFVYRVTAMGFGPRADIQAINQILYRD